MRRRRWSSYLRSQARLARFVAGGLNVPTDVEALETMAERYERVARMAEAHEAAH